MRNAVAFHYKDDFIKSNHVIKRDKTDIVIGFTIDGKTATTRFTLSMNYILTEIKKIIGDEFSPDSYLEYLNEKVLKNIINKKCMVLEQFILGLIGKNMYLEEDVYNING
jgi:hypothetical protein